MAHTKLKAELIADINVLRHDLSQALCDNKRLSSENRVLRDDLNKATRHITHHVDGLGRPCVYRSEHTDVHAAARQLAKELGKSVLVL